MKNVLKAQKNLYEKSFLKFGNRPQSTYQNNLKTQHIRYERLINNLRFGRKPESIHDVGSGLCDLHQYLLDKKVSHVYSGTELVPGMIRASHQKFPDIKIHQRNILSDKVRDSYDYVVLSGTFNKPGGVEKRAWRSHVFSMIRKMHKMSKKAIAFNHLTTHKTFTDPSLFYMDPGNIFNFCVKNLSRFVLVDHSYPLYELTITVYKKPFLNKLFPQKEFSKYFKN